MAIGNDKEKLTEVQIITKIVGWAAFAIFVLVMFFGSWYIIQAGQRGVILTMGNPSSIPASEGPHFKIPLVQTVVKMDIQTQKYEATASAASSDLQVVATNIAVNYHLTGDVVPTLYKDIGIDYREKVIQPAVQEVVKACTAKFTAEQLITQRENVKGCIDIGLKQRLADKGITMETTSITNFDFSAQFNAAIEQKVTQEQQALTAKNKLAQVEYEAQQIVATANGQRDAAIAAAEAQAKTRLLNAESEAKALELQRQQVTDAVLELRRIEVQLEYAKHWGGVWPTTYVAGSNSILPIMNIPVAGAVASTQ